MVKLLKEDHSIYDAFGFVISDGTEAWIVYADANYPALRTVTKYLDENLEDIVYTLKTAHEVADYIQKKFLNAIYLDVDFIPEDRDVYDVIDDDYIRLGHVLIKVCEMYDLEDYM